MKLHEVLAVEGQLKGQAEATRTELAGTFDKKRHLFGETVRTFQSSDEGAKPVTEEQSDLQSTIPQELAWISGIWQKAIDVSYQVAELNTIARASVILDDGTVIIANAPATALLELEKRAAEIQELVKKIPTLDPAKGFRLDPDRGKNIFKAREVTKKRTKKVVKVVTLADATKEHPAQAQMVHEDVPVGDVVEQEWSGLITPSQKGDMLERAEELRRAIKKARQRANDAEPPKSVTIVPVGASLFKFVFGV